MKIIETTILSEQAKEKVRALWNQEYPEKIKHNTQADLQVYLNTLNNLKHYLLIDGEEEIKGWAFSFQREAADWFAIILHSNIKNQGYGTLLLNRLKENRLCLYGWVIDHDADKKSDGEIYISPLGFYLKNNFVISAQERLETEKISAVKIQWQK
ncbi:MAG TPA: hypothetical protein PL029_02765 [Bacteroidia bacterium]|nr:hypothetical protein [Bacteroidia bacterium]